MQDSSALGYSYSPVAACVEYRTPKIIIPSAESNPSTLTSVIAAAQTYEQVAGWGSREDHMTT